MDYGHKLTDEELKELEKRINAEYTQAEKEVAEKLSNYLAGFMRRDIEQKMLVDAGEISEREYLNWRAGQIATGKRWEELRQSLAEDMHRTNVEAQKQAQSESMDIYALNHNYGTYEVENGAEIDTKYTLYDRQTVERLVKDNPQMLPPPGKKVSERIKAGLDVRWNNQHIQSVMMQSLLQGESIGKIATRLANAVGDSNRAAAIRNARTMTTGAENAGRVDAYERAKEMGVPVRQMWVATIDDRTRESHRKMDGETIEPGETFSNKCRFPGDPLGEPSEVYNCRCTLVARIPGVQYTFAERGTDKASYEEWKKGKETEEKPQVEEQKTEEPKVEEPKAEEIQPTIKEVTTKEEALEELGKIFDSVENNFTKNDERLIIENTNQLLKLNQRFGAITENNTGYITSSSSGKAMAYTSNRIIPDPNGNLTERCNLGLVGKYYKDYDTLIAEETKSVASFWGMPALEENYSIYTITHEYGHILENSIIVGRIDYDALKEKVSIYNASLQRKEYLREEKRNAKVIFNEILDIAKENNPDFDLKANLSEYGRTNHFEAFAEMFANSQMGAPNELGIAMQQWLEKEGF